MVLNDNNGWDRSSRHAEVCDIGRGPSDECDFNANLLVDSFLGNDANDAIVKGAVGFLPSQHRGKGATMERRNALGLLGAAGFLSLRSASRSEANVPDAASPSAPPRLSVADLIRLIGDKKFRFESIYAHELEFRAITIIDREVPLARINGMKDLYSQVHLYGGRRLEVGKEVVITGLIVDEGFGALMVWVRQCKYADAESGTSPDPNGK